MSSFFLFFVVFFFHFQLYWQGDSNSRTRHNTYRIFFRSRTYPRCINLFNKICALLGCVGTRVLVRHFHEGEQLPLCFPGRRIPIKLEPLKEEVVLLEDHIRFFENG